jgi:hypothetical protein
VFLELQDWEAALRMCASPAQRDVVHTAKADAAFAARDYATAAVHYAKVRECVTICADEGACRHVCGTLGLETMQGA